MRYEQYNNVAYDITRRILAEDMELNWSAEQPEQQQSVAQSLNTEVQSNNPDIQYIGKLVSELHSKLDSVFQLSANTNQWTRDTISMLLEVDNRVTATLEALNYAASLENTEGTTTAIISI